MMNGGLRPTIFIILRKYIFILKGVIRYEDIHITTNERSI